jgi:hypothetical protein
MSHIFEEIGKLLELLGKALEALKKKDKQH